MGLLWLRFFMRGLTVFLLAVALSACASGPKLVDHAFSYDTWNDSPSIEMLNYRYSIDHPEDWQLKSGGIGQRSNVSGFMPVGNSIYVKWRVKSTGAIYEDTVDLASRLPANMTDHRIHFVVKGPELYVYLISPSKRPQGSTGGPLRMYSDLIVYTLYPDPLTPNRFN